MAMSYKERKLKGQIRRWEYQRRLHHAEHLAVMFRGIGLGFSFILVMTAIAGVHGLLDFWIFVGFILIAGSGFAGAEHIMFWAEQSRYPKSRRRTLRSEIADEWREFREYRKSKRGQK